MCGGWTSRLAAQIFLQCIWGERQGPIYGTMVSSINSSMSSKKPEPRSEDISATYGVQVAVRNLREKLREKVGIGNKERVLVIGSENPWGSSVSSSYWEPRPWNTELSTPSILKLTP